MSDDTPTQRFDAAAGDAPTERFTAPTDPAAPSEEVVEERKSRRLIIILASVGGALLIAVLILLVVLLTRGGQPAPVPTPTTSSATPSASPTPTASPTPSPTSTPTPTPTVTPPSTDPSVDDFTIDPTGVDCSNGDPELYISWDTSRADYVYFGVDTDDASTGPFFGESLPASGNSNDDFPDGYSPFTFTCGAGQHKYTITAVTGNAKDSVSIVVTESDN